MPPEEKKERIPIKSLRTYQGDVDEAVAKNKYSSTTILVAEQKRKEEKPEKTLVPINYGAKNKLFIYLGGIFFVLGLGVVTSIYYIKYSEKTVVEQKSKTLLNFAKEYDIKMEGTTRDKLVTAIKENRDGFKMPINSVLYLNTTEGTAPSDSEKVLSLIGPSQPSSLLRSFDSQYMIGVYSYDTNEVFILLKIKDFASSYSGMLKWEKDMPSDLSKIFSINSDLISEATPFVDIALKNKDLRVLRDREGKTQLLYSFLDKETLLITKNEKVFSAILSRLTVSKQAR